MQITLFLKKNFYNINIILISILPIVILSPSLVINIYVPLCSLIFLIFCLKKKISFFKNKCFLILFIFWISLIVNLIFSSNFSSSFGRVFGFLRFIIFYLYLSYFFSILSLNNIKKIMNIWLLIFIITFFDLLYEAIIGHNILGNVSWMQGRLSSFLGKELKIGNYYFVFSAFALVTIYNYHSKDFLKIILISGLLLIIGFLIGERSNFLKNFIIIIGLLCFLYKKQFKNLLFLFFLFFFIFSAFVYNNYIFKQRYFYQFAEPILKLGPIEFYKNSHYGAHAITAIEIFKRNTMFGVGIRNFRNESGKKIYENKEYKYNHMRASTHPHQIYFEFLSETGVFGTFFLIFFLFKSINIYTEKLKIKLSHPLNNLKFSAFLVVLCHFIPLLPSGSFFTTYSATIFFSAYSLCFINSWKLNKKS